MRSSNYLIGVTIALGVLSCKKDKPDPVAFDEYKNGLLVLNEGLFQQNNSSITWISNADQSVANQVFYAANNRYIGDTGNDLLKYGSKIYVAVNASSTVEVLQANSLKSVAQIQMSTGGQEKQPRYLESFNGKVYVSCFDGFVDVVDTITNSVVNRIPVGLNPDAIKEVSGKLYVSNSGGLNFPTMDSTLSVIDLISETETIKITVGLNPGDMEIDSEGDLYVVTRGDYADVPAMLVKVDLTNNQVSELFEGAIEITAFDPGRFLITYDNGIGISIGLFNTVTDQWENPSFISTSGITTVYEVVYNENIQLIYVLDAMGYTNTGYVREYTAAGSLVRSYQVGLNPTDLIYLP